MFDRIMENSMAVWLLISAAYPVFLVAMLVKAVRHFRRLRGPAAYPPYPAYPAEFPAAEPTYAAAPRRDDWTPAR